MKKKQKLDRTKWTLPKDATVVACGQMIGREFKRMNSFTLVQEPIYPVVTDCLLTTGVLKDFMFSYKSTLKITTTDNVVQKYETTHARSKGSKLLTFVNIWFSPSTGKSGSWSMGFWVKPEEVPV